MADNMQEPAGDVGSTGGTEQQSTEAPNDNAQDTGGQAAVTGAETQGQNAPGDEGDPETVEGDDGKKYVPFEAFKARIDKLTAQKSQARQEVLEALKSDPAFKQEFMDSLKSGEESATAPEGSNEPTPFEKFLAPLPPEHQAHYRNMIGAVAQEFESYVQETLQEALKPILSHIGQERVRTFEQTNKDFPKYRRQVEKIMSEGRAKSIEDAFILATHEDRLKAAQHAGAKEELERRQKMARAPINRSAGGGATKGPGKFGLREALQRAGGEMGFTG